tara:strand:+ start:5447 stop:6364 length:918 start_codon:yes stop_codon:yes gene_type:complete
MRAIVFIIILFLNINYVYAIETKIIYKIQNEIITNVDIKNEFKYLLALNNELKNLDKAKIFKISKESIIKEKVKKIEILKYVKNLDVDKKYIDIFIQNMYLKMQLESLEDFIMYLKKYKVSIKEVERKIAIDALWKDLIITKYASKIEINELKIRKNIEKNQKKRVKEYLLSEIIFEVKSKNEIEKKYVEIKKSINQVGFENTASIYSFSDSSKAGGLIGWVNEKSFNKKIIENILNLNKGDISKPIIIPNGILILKINNLREVSNQLSQEETFKKVIIYERNKQLSQYSNIYFNKIKKNLNLNE